MPIDAHFFQRAIVTREVHVVHTDLVFGVRSEFCACKITRLRFVPPWLTSGQTRAHTHAQRDRI